MQKNWLGKSPGAVIKFAMQYALGKPSIGANVFTTRPDTLFGVQFLALSLSHPLVKIEAAADPLLQQFITNSHTLPRDSKAGYLIKGLHGVNPLTRLGTQYSMPDYISEPLPVFAATYVLDSYGEGAVMGVPGHDHRDSAFWQEHQHVMTIRKVIVPEKDEDGEDWHNMLAPGQPWELPGKLDENCGDYRHLSSEHAAARIVQDLELIGHAKHSPTWKLRDWLVSRQRYWGTPIPIIHCQSCGAVPVPVADLPVVLPNLDTLNRAGNPLDSASDWVNTQCPKCQGPAQRETDTMDTFVDSSWYFMRFPDAHNVEQPFSAESADATLPVDVYIGGVEHAILHLLYARFISKFVHSIGLWSSGGKGNNKAEPFRQLITQGMVQGKTFSDPLTGRFLRPDEVDKMKSSRVENAEQSFDRLKVTWEKMSKSKNNGVDATASLEKYGADALRAHMLFQAPVSEVLQWEEKPIVGIQRWFGKLSSHVNKLSDHLCKIDNLEYEEQQLIPRPATFTDDEASVYALMNDTITSVTDAFSETYSLNTAISDLIKLTNALTSKRILNLGLQYYSTSALLRLLAPVAPALAEEFWAQLHSYRKPFQEVSEHLQPVKSTQSISVPSIFDEQFPIADMDSEQATNTQRCAVQENGKLRFVVSIPKAPTEDELGKAGVLLHDWVLLELARTDAGKRWHDGNTGREWKRVVVVKGGKTVNFVG